MLQDKKWPGATGGVQCRPPARAESIRNRRFESGDSSGQKVSRKSIVVRKERAEASTYFFRRPKRWEAPPGGSPAERRHVPKLRPWRMRSPHPFSYRQESPKVATCERSWGNASLLAEFHLLGASPGSTTRPEIAPVRNSSRFTSERVCRACRRWFWVASASRPRNRRVRLLGCMLQAPPPGDSCPCRRCRLRFRFPDHA
jgi:hypothetical protein